MPGKHARPNFDLKSLALKTDAYKYPPVGYAPLHHACHVGDVALVTQLINEGHFVNETTFDLVQPLHEACFNGHLDCATLLLDAGANVNGRNIDGSTPLCDACSSGHEDLVQLLLSRGATVNPKLLLSSPLHEAVLRDKWRCADLLIEAGAALNHTDCHFGTPLHAAVLKGSINSMKSLLKAGCNVNSSKILYTPLHFAARQQDPSLVQLLLEFGANPWLTTNAHKAARDMVPSSTSHVKELLAAWESTPRSLKFLCRHVIRSKVGPGRLKQLSSLKLPTPLHDYVTYSYI